MKKILILSLAIACAGVMSVQAADLKVNCKVSKTEFVPSEDISFEVTALVPFEELVSVTISKEVSVAPSPVLVPENGTSRISGFSYQKYWCSTGQGTHKKTETIVTQNPKCPSEYFRARADA